MDIGTKLRQARLEAGLGFRRSSGVPGPSESQSLCEIPRFLLSPSSLLTAPGEARPDFPSFDSERGLEERLRDRSEDMCANVCVRARGCVCR